MSAHVASADCRATVNQSNDREHKPETRIEQTKLLGPKVEIMCRNIRTLFNFKPMATRAEIRAAAEQYVRKISGFSKPSILNEDAFATAVDEVTLASSRLLKKLQTKATPRDRQVEASKAKARAAKRFGKRAA